jgi:hypothetical protein
LFAALKAGNLIRGDKTNKQECGLASFDSGGRGESPLPRTAAFVEYTYFLLNMCHAIHSWVMKQDEADTDSDAVPDFESMFHLHENKEDRMINFLYRICRLMEFFLDKRIVKKQRSMIAVGGHPLPDNWVHPKKLQHADLRLPPCAGGPIPTTYVQEHVHSITVVKMVDDNADVEESEEVKKERNDMQEYLILSFMDRTGIAKKTLKLYNKAFKSWAKQKNKALSKNHQRRKSNFKASWSTYQDRLQDYIQKNEFATNHGVCDECSKMAEKDIVCVHRSVCVHPLPDCCRFYGNQLSCIDCYRRRHVIFVPLLPAPGKEGHFFQRRQDTARVQRKGKIGRGKKMKTRTTK